MLKTNWEISPDTNFPYKVCRCSGKPRSGFSICFFTPGTRPVVLNNANRSSNMFLVWIGIPSETFTLSIFPSSHFRSILFTCLFTCQFFSVMYRVGGWQMMQIIWKTYTFPKLRENFLFQYSCFTKKIVKFQNNGSIWTGRCE